MNAAQPPGARHESQIQPMSHLTLAPHVGVGHRASRAQDLEAQQEDAKLRQAVHAASDAIRACTRSGTAGTRVSALRLLQHCILLYTSPAMSKVGMPAQEVAPGQMLLYKIRSIV